MVASQKVKTRNLQKRVPSLMQMYVSIPDSWRETTDQVQFDQFAGLITNPNSFIPFTSYAGMTWSGLRLRRTATNSTLLPASPPMMAWDSASVDPKTPKEIPMMTTQGMTKEPFAQVYLEGLSFACTKAATQIVTSCTLNITGYGIAADPGIPLAGPFSTFSDYTPQRNSSTRASLMQSLSLTELGSTSGSWGVNTIAFNAEGANGTSVDLYLDSLSYITAVDGGCCIGPGTCTCPI